jgi:putative transposase
LIRDEEDWKRHLDYIHYNPVKHGYVESPARWPFSTFAKYVRLGEYEEGWGQSEPETVQGMDVAEMAGS